MVEQIKPAQNNAKIYFSELLMRLNKYEGDSHYFNNLNKAFVNFLQDLLLVCNSEQNEITYKKLLKDSAFKRHPFLPLIIRLLNKSRISAALRNKTLETLKKHPEYPLLTFLEYSLSVTTKTTKIPTQFVKIFEQGDPLITYYNKYLPPKLFSKEQETLTKLENEGFTFATLLLIEKNIKQKQYDVALEKINIAARQSNLNKDNFLGYYYISFAKSLTLDHPFGRSLAQKSVELKNYELLPELVAYFAHGDDKNEALFLYYLVISAHNGDEKAIKKLADFYKDNDSLARFLQIKD